MLVTGPARTKPASRSPRVAGSAPGLSLRVRTPEARRVATLAGSHAAQSGAARPRPFPPAASVSPGRVNGSVTLGQTSPGRGHLGSVVHPGHWSPGVAGRGGRSCSPKGGTRPPASGLHRALWQVPWGQGVQRRERWAAAPLGRSPGSPTLSTAHPHAGMNHFSLSRLYFLVLKRAPILLILRMGEKKLPLFLAWKVAEFFNIFMQTRYFISWILSQFCLCTF